MSHDPEAEAVLLFAAWLTSYPGTLEIGDSHPAGLLPELVTRFCEFQGWSLPDELGDISVPEWVPPEVAEVEVVEPEDQPGLFDEDGPEETPEAGLEDPSLALLGFRRPRRPE